MTSPERLAWLVAVLALGLALWWSEWRVWRWRQRAEDAMRANRALWDMVPDVPGVGRPKWLGRRGV